MKPSYLAVVIALVAFFSVSSCSKEELTTQGGGGDTGSPYPKSEIDLTAANWTRVTSSIYICPLQNAIPPGNADKVVKIYVLTADKKLQINSPIGFMGGQLSATISGLNVSLMYTRSDNEAIPFSYLNIKVVIQ